MPSTSPVPQNREPPTPDEQARAAYNAAVRGAEKADELLADAARQTDQRRREKLASKAAKAYDDAARKFAHH